MHFTVTLVKLPPGEACLHDDVTFNCTSTTTELTWSSPGVSILKITNMSTIGSHALLGSLLNITVINNNPIQATASLIGGAEFSRNGIAVTCSGGENEEINSQVIVAGIKL